MFAHGQANRDRASHVAFVAYGRRQEIVCAQAVATLNHSRTVAAHARAGD